MVLSHVSTIAALLFLVVAALRPEPVGSPVPPPSDPPPPSVRDARGVPLAGVQVSVEIAGAWRCVGVTGPMGELPELARGGELVVAHPSFVPARLGADHGQTIVLPRAGHLRGRLRGACPDAELLAWPAGQTPEGALDAARRRDPAVPRCGLEHGTFLVRGLDPGRRWSLGVVRRGEVAVLAQDLEVGRADLRFDL